MNEWKRLKKSFGHARDGIIHTVRTQRNMRIHVAVSLLVIPFGFLLSIELQELLLVIFAVFLVLITEMINTAVESVVDMVTEEYHHLAKIAKDASAGAVLFAAVLSVIIGIGVFGPPLFTILGW
ncbi:MAG: diacylglycerol kinase family protein [Bacillaceae bacterium]|nr:diacylglycerol kinase family protein [Bacillaceae bacterium]